MLYTSNHLLNDRMPHHLPIFEQSWQEFYGLYSGSFCYSIVSITYSIAILAVITWFLNIYVVVNCTTRATWLLKCSAFLSSVYFLVTVILSVRLVNEQQSEGYLQGVAVINYLEDNLALNILDLITVFLLQINQVQVVMRLFQRQSDKRLTFYVGIFAALTSQIIWAIVTFHSFPKESEVFDILPAFIYLVRIAMAASYASLILVFIMTHLRYIIPYKRIWLLTILTCILIFGPAAFFVADVANIWIYDLSEMLSVVTYDLCVVIPWAWCNEYASIKKAKESEGVLGRRFYEDELYELDRFQLFTEDDNSMDDEGHDEGDNTGTSQTTHASSIENTTNEADNRDNSIRGGSSTRSVENNNHNSRQERSIQFKLESLNNRLLRRAAKNKHNDSLHNSGEHVSDVNNYNDQENINENKLSLNNTLWKLKNAFLELTDDVISIGMAIPRSVTGSTSNIFPDVDVFEEEIADEYRDTPLSRENPGINPNSTGINSRNDVFVYSRKNVNFDLSDE